MRGGGFAGADNGAIDSVELIEHAALDSCNGYPGIAPGRGGIDNLEGELVAGGSPERCCLVPTLAKRLSASSKSFKRTATWLSLADSLVVIRPNFLCTLCILTLGSGPWVVGESRATKWGA